MRNIKPRYVDIAETLESELRNLAPNSLLPTEDQMAKRFGVSRITVRAALEMLENSGLISRLRGRGTIVSPQKLVRNFSPYLSFESDMKKQGVDVTTRLLSFDKDLRPPTRVAQNLDLGEDEKVSRISLIRIVNDQVICHDHRYYPASIARKINPKEVESRTCSEIVQEAAAAKIRRVHWDSEILSATQEVASALSLANRTLIFTSNYVWYAKNRVPIETGMVSYRIDRCKFRFQERMHDDIDDTQVAAYSPSTMK